MMMFLEYAIRGVWMPYLASYLGASKTRGGLGFTGGQTGWIVTFGTSVGALTSPFIMGQLADRWLNAERALALFLTITGVLLWFMAGSTMFPLMMLLACLASITYMPTPPLSNAIALANVADRERQFPVIRAFGTLGWILASSLFTLLWLRSRDATVNTARVADALHIGAFCTIGYAIYSLLVVPPTPPRRDQAHPLAFLHAFALLRRRDFLVLWLIAIPLSMIHTAILVRISPWLEQEIHVPLRWVGPTLAVGQTAELLFLAMLGLLIKRWGYKRVLLLACSGYIVRFSVFGAVRAMPLIIAAQALHGLCYACFFAAGVLYVEKVAPPDARSSAQATFGIAVMGLGPMCAAIYNQLLDRYVQTTPGAANFDVFWYSQAAVALFAGIVVVALFHERPTGEIV
jgi:nucleoside transporter